MISDGGPSSGGPPIALPDAHRSSGGPSSGGPRGPSSGGPRRRIIRGPKPVEVKATPTRPPGPPGAGAERVRAQQRFAHPDDDYVPPERGEPKIQPELLHDPLPEPESLTDQPPPFPPPASVVVTKSPPPPAATAPRSLPAGALVPKNRSACRRTENVQGGQPQQGGLFSRPTRWAGRYSGKRVVCAN